MINDPAASFPPKLILIPAAIVLAIFFWMIFLSPSLLIYDERFYLEGAKLLTKGGSIHEVLMLPLPVGPLYHTLHAITFPLTNLEAPQVRWLNLSLILVSIGALSISIHLHKFKTPLYRAAVVLSVPMFWVTGGMALTEIPAFTMATLSLLAVTFATRPETKSGSCYISFMIAGMFAGLSILGRQTYLPLIFVFGLLAWRRPVWRVSAISAFLIAFLMPLPLFLTWGGLVPESQSKLAGISMTHGLISVAYLGATIVILAPSYFNVLVGHWKWLSVLTGLAVILNLSVFHLRFRSFASLSKYLPISEENYTLLIGSVLLVLFLIVALATILNLLKRWDDHLFVVMTALSFASALTAFAITHQFSSRYVMACFPFVVLMIQPFYAPSLWSGVRFLLGACIGATVLASYYGWI